MSLALSDPRTQAPRTYQALRSSIVQGRLKPLEKLKISELAADFEVSPGAVREALSRLTTENLVEARDQRGFRVAPISLAELDDLTHTRIQIEILALRQSIARGDAAWAASLHAAHEAMVRHPPHPDDPRGTALHAEFHTALVAGCGSPSLMRIREALYDQSERYRCFAVRSALANRPVAAEHAAMTEAALSRDAEAAAAVLSAHIALTSDLVRAALAENR